MKPFLIAAALLVSTVSASLHGAVSTQYQHLDPHSHTYSYGYADPNSQKHETRAHDGTTRGSYSYVDGHGHVQSVSYTADPHHGFNAVGTNLPQAPHAAPVYAAAHAHSAYAPYAPYAHGIHIPVLTHGGVPVDTPEVQHAKAAHAAAHAAAAHNAGGHHLYKRSIYGGGWSYGAPAHVPLTHGGVPVDTPDVQAAKAEHYAAHAKALGQVAHAHGAPVETPEVQHAKAAHFAAHAAARSGHVGAPIAHGNYHVPVIHNGVPVDTPEVQHAKAAHFAALSQASAHGSSGHSSWDDGRYDGRWESSQSSHGGYAGGYAHNGPIHIPVIHNGVPVEPAEVQHARAAHLNAVAAASHGGAGAHGGYYGGAAGGHEDDGQYHSHYDHY
ncbi:histidine-rich protein PFHRP-II [Drosophila guanche]|uniref:Blast:Cuticle protein 7 n=1 Tax=Drosophila guanche TaxID=7266 RepID=A0A3B0KAJ0_DROGU|nr:histidine-rich protein PFHRP-II [Drosophila guanche]SPP83109.1 blast:Cuticle protein 7 [Drosophila guanche]